MRGAFSEEDAWRSAARSVAGSAWLAVGFESIVEDDVSLRNISVERQGEKDLLWHSLKHEAGDVLEPELPVVVWMPDETAAGSTQIS